MNSVKFIGMDVHKKTITIAIAEQGSRESARVYGAKRLPLNRIQDKSWKVSNSASRDAFPDSKRRVMRACITWTGMGTRPK